MQRVFTLLIHPAKATTSFLDTMTVTNPDGLQYAHGSLPVGKELSKTLRHESWIKEKRFCNTVPSIIIQESTSDYLTPDNKTGLFKYVREGGMPKVQKL